jgi:uncharacterized repeat protein (TIGR02543 family)
MKKLRIIFVLLITTGMLLLDISTALAVPPFPASFYGTVKLDGANVPAGTQVYAFINNIQYGSSPYMLYNGDTVYSLNVPGDDISTPGVIEGGTTGDTVVFRVGSSRADQTVPWQAGTNTNLNLTATTGYNLSINRTGTGSGTVALGSTFTGWSGACAGTSNACLVIMDSAKSVTANFTINTYALTVDKAGSGTVTSSPVGIDCGSTCSYNFEYDTLVTLAASASTGYTFTGWSGACTNTSSTCIVTMTDTRSVTATFTINSYALSVALAGNGSGTVTSLPTGIDCGSTCSASYNYNTAVTLTAAAATGSTFAGWSGGVCSGSLNTCVVTTDAAKSVTATFTLNSYALMISMDGNGSGAVTSLPAGIDCGSTCSASFNYNSSVTLTATSATGSTFAGWSGGGCSGSLSTCVVTMDAGKSVTATFIQSEYSLTTSVVGGGNITRDNMGPYFYGQVVQLTAVPDPGWNFSGWSSDLNGSVNPASLTINANKSVTATFTQNVYTLTIIKAGTGSGTVSSLPIGIDCGTACSYNFADNAVVTLSASPMSTSFFGGWSGSGCSGTNPCTVTMDMARSVTATFMFLQHIYVPILLLH